MSVSRIAAMSHAGSVPAASAIPDKNSWFTARLRPRIESAIAGSRTAANLVVALSTPVALVALVLALWRLTADLGWTDAFFISDGLFSHWQVWIVLAAFLKIGVSALATKAGVNGKISEESATRV